MREPVSDWGHFQARFHAVRRSAPGYACNLYAGRDEVEAWIARSELTCLAVGGAVMFLRADQDFHRVFHVAEDTDALGVALDAVGTCGVDGAVVTDLIGLPATVAPVEAIYEGRGYRLQTCLKRMSSAAIDWKRNGPSDCNDVVVATPADALAIATFLDRLLDRHAERVPTSAELEIATAAGKVLLARTGAVPSGVLIFEQTGRTAMLRFWHVDAHARGQGVGGRLIHRFFEQCAQVQRIVLWVKSDNARTIAIYERYGFAMEQLADRILINHIQARAA